MKDEILVKPGDIVFPGQILAEGMDFIPSGNALREGKQIISTSLGLISIKGRVVKSIPLAGRYNPKPKDSVIGKVVGINKYGWSIEIRCHYEAELNVLDYSSRRVDTRTPLTKLMNIGDFVFAEVYEINKQGYLKLSMKNRPYQKLSGGVLIEVSPSKIPRIIGKQGSMIKILKDESKCNIIVGQNGWIWIKGEPENVMAVSNAIKKIEKESHTHGLTDAVKALLSEVK